jgi:hypothetical protein
MVSWDDPPALNQSWATRRKWLIRPAAVDAGGPVFNASSNTIGVSERTVLCEM